LFGPELGDTAVIDVDALKMGAPAVLALCAWVHPDTGYRAPIRFAPCATRPA
jgi:hypothetical protein